MSAANLESSREAPSRLPLGLGGSVESAMDEFADLAGLAAELWDIGERESALQVLALACAALTDVVEGSGVDMSKARLPPPSEVVPMTDLALSIGADGLYSIVSSAVALHSGDSAARNLLERFLEAAGVDAEYLSDEELAASALAYLAASMEAVAEE